MLKEIITSKAGFPFYTDYWKSYFCKMTGEQVKECLKIIFHFNETFEILQSEDLAIEMVVTTIIGNIRRDAEKRTKQILANKENGMKGGRPRGEQKINKSEGKETKKDKKIKGFIPPSLEEIQNYCQERNNSVSAKKFLDYYVAGNWKDKDGKSVKNWKQKLLSWEGRKEEKTISCQIDTLAIKLNQIAGANYFQTVLVGEIVQITCAPGMKTKAYSLPTEIKEKIKAQFQQPINIK